MAKRLVILIGIVALLFAGAMAVVSRHPSPRAPAAQVASKPAAAPEMVPVVPAAAPPSQPAPVAAAPAEPAPALPPAAADKPALPAPQADAAPTPAAPIPPVASLTPDETKPPAPPAVAALPPQPQPTVTVPALPPDRPTVGEDKLPAKELFAAKQLPSLGKAMAIGYYPRGCLQGGVELPVNGPTWQVMRLSRNRNWGHPELVKFLERFAPLAAKATGWKGILVGDMAQPRGGPLPFGHLSHQIGLDVDIWFMPMPDHELSRDEREKISAINVVADDWLNINPKVWTPQHEAFIRTAAEQPEVERVLVNAAIKKELCRIQGKDHFDWMSKVRPWYGHQDHIHVRLKCPDDSPNCRKQPPVPGDDGCSKASLDHWFSGKVLNPQKKPFTGARPKGLMLTDLPPACKSVLDAPARVTQTSGN